MPVKMDLSGLKRTKWHEYLVRFAFGGLITAATGLIAKKFGPEVGGLFLAFPAIFPATATLIEKHETDKKKQKGVKGIVRGRDAASVDAAGSAMGSIGLFVFAVLVLHFIEGHNLWLVLSAATLCWLGVSVATWFVRKRLL
ncbi:MAG TPA: DUF3147 family protein [Candidatus Sulfotelmatobacter sp.]|nr:DUF3147 family protein [Candidatus Sulfotelmatobacter sp.]